jgi:Spy/CpxP family protein refolding chaperone
MLLRHQFIKSSVAALLVVNVCVSGQAMAEESAPTTAPTSQPATQPAPHAYDSDDKKPARTKMWGIWRKLTSLTPEQKATMAAIHEKALSDKKKIEQQEESDLLAQLTDDQKLELQTLKEAVVARKKARDAEKAAEKEAEKTVEKSVDSDQQE